MRYKIRCILRDARSMVPGGLVMVCWGSGGSFVLCLSLNSSVDRSKSESF